LSPAKRHKAYSTFEFSKALSDHGVDLHPRTIGRMVDDGELAGYRTRGDHRRILARELRRYLKQILDKVDSKS
jgi:excisionase family DNA binding protein